MTTAAKPIGDCPNCGATRYAFLVHHCRTAVKVNGALIRAGGTVIQQSPRPS